MPTGVIDKPRQAKFKIGQVVRHRIHPFRGVIFDVDPTFSNTDEWYESIPVEMRPAKDQPFYHLFAENEVTEYIAYVSEQNLLPDTSGDPSAIRRSTRSSTRTARAITASGAAAFIEPRGEQR